MEERKMILKMIEEGKITAEEGLALLDSLEKLDRNSKQSTGNTKGAPEQMNKVRDEFYDTTEKIITSANKGVSKLIDLVSKAVQRLQDVEFEFDNPFQSGTKVTEQIDLPSFPHRQIRFSTTSGSIRCKAWDEDYAQIQIKGTVAKVKDEPEAKKLLKEALKITESANYVEVILENKKGIKASLEIMLPRVEFERIVFQTNHGSIQAAHLDVQQLEAKTSNGSIRMTEMNIEDFQAGTSNGRIQLQDVEIKKAELKTTNGSIQLNGQLESLDCSTTNGSIRIEQENTETSHILAKTNNGSIRVEYPPTIKGVHGELNTKFGSVECLLPNVTITDEKTNTNEKFMAFEQGDLKFHRIKITSETGAIQVKEKGETEENEKVD